MSYNIAAIRELVGAAFGDDELSTFCFDYYPAVYEQFTAGQTKGTRVRMLIEHAQQQRRLGELLVRVQRANPRMYAEFAPRLTTAGPTPRPVAQRPAISRLALPLVIVGAVCVVLGAVCVANRILGGHGTPTPRPTEAAAQPTATSVPTPYPTETAPEPTATFTPSPLYRSGLITYLTQDENGKSLHALGPDGSPVTLVKQAADLMVLAVSPGHKYLAVAVSQKGPLSLDSTYPRFVASSEDSTVSLVVVSEDGRDSTTVVSSVPRINAAYASDGRLIVAVLKDSAITYTVARTDGREPRDLYYSYNVLVTPALPATVEAP